MCITCKDQLSYEETTTMGLSEHDTKGLKADSGKNRMDLIPWPAVWAMANVRQFGAEKYRPWDWDKGIEYSRLAAAALRHITAWLSGEDLDPESGQSHIAHALTGLAFLETYIMQCRKELDDRYHYVKAVSIPGDIPVHPKSAIA